MRNLVLAAIIASLFFLPLALATPAEAGDLSLEGAVVGLANVPGGAVNCAKGIVDEIGKTLDRLIVFMPVTAALSCAANILVTTPAGAVTFLTAGAAQFGKASDLSWSASPPPIVFGK